jgi:hypothetical protein
MSATSDTQSSTDSDLNVLVAALGLAGNERYVKNPEALADKAESAIQSIAGMNGRRVDNVVVRENFALEQELEDRLDEDALPDVQYYGIDFRRVLDDAPETYDDGNRETQGVMLTAEQKAGEDEDASDYTDDEPIAKLVMEHVDLNEEVEVEVYDQDAGEMVETTRSLREHMTDALETVDDDFDASEDEFSVAEHFDLRIREHREAIPMGEVDQQRINRAKARSRAKTDERLYNDWFDNVPTVDGAVFLHDGSDRGMAAVEAARGQNPWVKYPSSCNGTVLEVSCNQDEDQIIDWARYLLETDEIDASELTDEQEEELREMHSDDDLEFMGLDVESSEAEAPEPPAANADAGQPASAD